MSKTRRFLLGIGLVTMSLVGFFITFLLAGMKGEMPGVVTAVGVFLLLIPIMVLGLQMHLFIIDRLCPDVIESEDALEEPSKGRLFMTNW